MSAGARLLVACSELSLEFRFQKFTAIHWTAPITIRRAVEKAVRVTLPRLVALLNTRRFAFRDQYRRSGFSFQP